MSIISAKARARANPEPERVLSVERKDTLRETVGPGSNRRGKVKPKGCPGRAVEKTVVHTQRALGRMEKAGAIRISLCPVKVVSFVGH